MKLSCAVAADLLPLYAEKMTSAETNALVEEHLRECPACRKRLEELQAPAVMPVDADAMPLKKLQKVVRRRRRAAVWTAVLLSLAVAVAVFGMLSAPHYLSYDHAVRVTEREDGLVTVEFLPGVTGYELTREKQPDSGETGYSISAYSTQLARLTGRGTPQEIVLNPQHEPLGPVYYCEMKGGEDVLLYGVADGGRITLPRHMLAFYAYAAFAALVVCLTLLFAFWKKKRVRAFFADAALAPACYLAAQLCIGGAASTYTLLRDFTLTVLLAALLYAALVVLHRGVLLHREG